MREGAEPISAGEKKTGHSPARGGPRTGILGDMPEPEGRGRGLNDRNFLTYNMSARFRLAGAKVFGNPGKAALIEQEVDYDSW